jgi:hypothetical protein
MDSNNTKGILKQFDEAYALVTVDRRHTYGPPEDTYRRISGLRAIVDECPDRQVREILGMIITKVARLVQTPEHLDSWIDIAGYARVGAMLLDDRSRDVGQKASVDVVQHADS